MNLLDLESLSLKELRVVKKEMNVKGGATKKQILDNIMTYRFNSYIKGDALGEPGKDAVVYSTTQTNNRQKMALKQFNKRKSVKKIIEEFEFQEDAANRKISPRTIDIDTERKFFVMEKLDKHLIDVTSVKHVSIEHQKQLITIYKTLDELGIFHGDPNPLNYMLRKGKLYIIDFGMAKNINRALRKKLDSDRPNLDIMTLSMVLKLKNMDFPVDSYSYLMKYVPKKYNSLIKN